MYTACALLVVQWLVLSPSVQSSMITRYRTNLAFYGGYSTDHRSVLYSNSAVEEWKNLSQLAEEAGLEHKALLCGLGSGAWLAYPEADYQSMNDASNYAMLLVGDACIPADNMNSVQAIGPINKEPLGLITFTEPYFASEGQWITNETSTASDVKSLICPAGHAGEWTLEGGGNKICIVRPKDLLAGGVCIFPDIENQLSMESATVTIGCPDIKGKSVFTPDENESDDCSPVGADCDNSTSRRRKREADDDMKVVLLQTCFGTFGAFKIIDNYLPLPQMLKVCKDGADEPHKLGFYKVVDAWKFRMNKDRQAELNPADIDLKRLDPKNMLRMRLLTDFFLLFQTGCPNVPEIYFNLLRYLFMQHLKAVWEEVPFVLQDRNDTRLSWEAAADEVKECLRKRRKDPVPKLPEELQCIAKSRYEGDDEDWEKQALDLFLSGDILDHVIEQVWLILNYVSAYCSTVRRFTDNFWAEFTHKFRRNFLLPLIQQWIHPGTWQVYYDYMFSGFSIVKEKRQIIGCLQDILQRTPVADPVDRPSASIKEFGRISKKKPPVDEPEPEKPTPTVVINDKTAKPAAKVAATTTKPETADAAKSRKKRSNKITKTHRHQSRQKLMKELEVASINGTHYDHHKSSSTKLHG